MVQLTDGMSIEEKTARGESMCKLRDVFRMLESFMHLVIISTLATCCILLTSCGLYTNPVRLYEGPPIPKDKVCIIWPHCNGLFLYDIDGSTLTPRCGTYAELLPGLHYFNVGLDYSRRRFISKPEGAWDYGYHVLETFKSRQPFVLQYQCSAGHEYIFGFELNMPNNDLGQYGNENWKPYIKDKPKGVFSEQPDN